MTIAETDDPCVQTVDVVRAGRLRPGVTDYRVTARIGDEIVAQERRTLRVQSPQGGAFSISLAVKDIEASKTFYEKFGLKIFGGNAAQNLASFTDVRELQRQLKAEGVHHGNPILADQHV